jgi:hypothetical protein
MVKYDNEDHIISSPGKLTLTPGLADRRPNIRLIGIVVASGIDDILGVTVDSTQETSTLSSELNFSPFLKAEQSTHFLHLHSVPSLTKSVGFTTLSKHFQPRKSVSRPAVVCLLFVLALLRLRRLIQHQLSVPLPLEQRNLWLLFQPLEIGFDALLASE